MANCAGFNTLGMRNCQILRHGRESPNTYSGFADSEFELLQKRRIARIGTSTHPTPGMYALTYREFRYP